MAKCGKLCFPTRGAAEAAMRSVPAKLGRVPTRAYRCGKCRAWHYTSGIKASRRRQY